MTGRSALASPQRTLPERQDALFLDLGDVSRKMFRFWVLLVLSAIRPDLADLLGLNLPPSGRRARQNTAIGLTGEPVPVGSRSGAVTHRNDHRPAAAHAAASSVNCR